MDNVFKFDTADEVEKFCKADGIDESLGLVFGWAIICKEDGADYFDVQGDHIPEQSMLKASSEFMSDSRLMKEMHAGDGKGSVVFAWPLTDDVAKAMGLLTARTGLMIAVKPDDPAILEKFKDGTYTGFSIGGTRQKDEDVAEKFGKTLPSNASAADYIHDFVHSNDKRFKGKSKEERIRMALGAYYGKQVPGAANIEGPIHQGGYMSNQKKKKKPCYTGAQAIKAALDKAWDESKHPRKPKGGSDGGQFSSDGGGDKLTEDIKQLVRDRRRAKQQERDTRQRLVSRPFS